MITTTITDRSSLTSEFEEAFLKCFRKNRLLGFKFLKENIYLTL